MVCLVVNHFPFLRGGAHSREPRWITRELAKKLRWTSIDTWSLLASFGGSQCTQSGHIWGGPNMSCWKGDALNIDLFGSTAFWGRIGEQNRHTCHWNTSTTTPALLHSMDATLPTGWTSGFFFYRCSRFLSGDVRPLLGDLIEKKFLLHRWLYRCQKTSWATEWKVKGVIRSNCQVHFSSVFGTRMIWCFWKL